MNYFQHNSDSEMPLSINIAFLLHSRSRILILIKRFYDMCISYHCMLTLWFMLMTALGNSVSKHFKQDGLVCPPNLRSKISWHRTVLSGTQHLEDENDATTSPVDKI